MNKGQTPYQRMMTPPQGGATPYVPAQQSAPQMPSANNPAPTQQMPPVVKKNKINNLFKGFGRGKPVEESVEISIDPVTGRRLLFIALGFLVFYLLLMWSILQNDYNSGQATAKSDHLQTSSAEALLISVDIDKAVLTINSALRQGESPSQTARLATDSPLIDAAVVMDVRRNVIGAYPEGSEFLADVSVEGIPANTVKINSIIQTDGTVIPVIIKRSGNYFVVTGFKPGALLKQPKIRRARLATIVAPGGRVIVGNKGFGRKGLLEVYGIDNAKLNYLTKPGKQSIETLEIGGTKSQLVSVPIQNTNLFLIEAIPATVPALFKKSLILFSILFVGIATLVWLLLKQLFKQIESMRTIQKNTVISQQRFQAAVEGDRGGVWEIDLANNIAYVSASLASLLGLPRSEHKLPTDQFLSLFHPQDRERFLAFARRAHMQGEFDFDMNVAHLPVILQCRGRPLTRAGSEQQRVIVGVALDITEQRGAQARLVATEARLHGALVSMTDSFVIWDAMKRLVIWNKRFEDFFGLQPGQLQAGMEQASIEYMIRPAIAEVIDPKSGTGSVEIKLADGRWIRYIETPTAEGGNVSIGTNITEIRTREAELRENEKALQNTVGILRKSQEGIFELAQRYEEEKIRAEDANQSKSDFLANMSHELRTPLNAINGFSDIMQKEMFGPLGDPRYKEYVNDILFSGQHLLALINDILDMSKIEAGKMNLNTEVMFMHEMISQVVRIIRGRAEESQLKLNIYADEVREIEADPRAVKQVLLNLLTNAIKFTPENGEVQVELIQKKSGLIVKVSDSGIGISQENIERLAKPFEQVTDHSNKHKEGTGLGLALSKSLVELHGGNFKIESQLGQGTTVIFSLPNKPIERKEEVKDNHVTQEISRLANDIASVLSDNEGKLVPGAEPEATPNPYPYAQPAPAQGEQPTETTEPIPYEASVGRPAA